MRVAGVGWRQAAWCLAVAGVAIWTGACSRGSVYSDSRLAGRATVDPKTGTSASPRIHREGEAIPKGGGHYKLGKPYKIAGRWYVPREEPGYDRMGVASWYGADFHGRKTANGEIYDMNALTAAHPTLPLPSYAYVTNLENGRTVLVRINDRGPYANDRIIDLSRQTARVLGTEAQGLARVRVRYAGRAPLNGDDRHERQMLAAQPWWRGGSAGGTAVAQQPAVRTGLMAETSGRQAADGGWSPFAHRAGRSGLGGR